jgi:cupin fold WbuC family metalloprotein
MQLIGAPEMAELLTGSRTSPRRRSHLLLHAGHDDQVQRLLIALQPGTYVRPHRHSEQWEMLVCLTGGIDVLSFDAEGRLSARQRLNAAAPVIQIPVGTWHGAVALQADTVVMEMKPGPYRPNEFAPWTPDEGTATATRLVQWMETAAVGAALQRSP